MQDLLNYQLPEHLIAKYPAAISTSAKMLSIARNSCKTNQHTIADLPSLLNPGDCIVVNDTKVIPAQLNGHKISGGKVHCQIDKIIDEQQAIVFLKSNKAPKINDIVLFEKQINLQIILI